MQSYFKKVDIKWADLDANRHVSNMAYVALLDHARMSYFNENGFSQEMFEKHRLGPIVFNQQMFFLKEVLPATTVQINVELQGSTEDYRFVQFGHSIYNHEGARAVYGYLTVAFMDLDTRKLMPAPPKPFLDLLQGLPKSEHFKILTKVDIKLPELPGPDTISI